MNTILKKIKLQINRYNIPLCYHKIITEFTLRELNTYHGHYMPQPYQRELYNKSRDYFIERSADINTRINLIIPWYYKCITTSISLLKLNSVKFDIFMHAYNSVLASAYENEFVFILYEVIKDSIIGNKHLLNHLLTIRAAQKQIHYGPDNFIYIEGNITR